MGWEFAPGNNLVGPLTVASLPISFYGVVKNASVSGDEHLIYLHNTSGDTVVLHIKLSTAGGGTASAMYYAVGTAHTVTRPTVVNGTAQPIGVTLDVGSLTLRFGAADTSGDSVAHAFPAYATSLASVNVGLYALSGSSAEFIVFDGAIDNTLWAALVGGALPETVVPGTIRGQLRMFAAPPDDGDTVVDDYGHSFLADGDFASAGWHPISRDGGGGGGGRPHNYYAQQ